MVDALYRGAADSARRQPLSSHCSTALAGMCRRSTQCQPSSRSRRMLSDTGSSMVQRTPSGPIT
ncbi:UNVERIFIED_ORG: hypothetical protein GGR78_002582 [Xanthomonas campestris]